jgi:hypothetical protein
LRHTFGTHLSKNGVAPHTAQAAMRYSSLDLTMNAACERGQQTRHEARGRVPKGYDAAPMRGAQNVYAAPGL